MPNREDARQAAEALLAQARAELALKKQARLERAGRRARRWESPLIPASVAALVTWSIFEASGDSLLSIAIGVIAGYVYAALGRRSAQDALDRMQGN